MIVGADDQVQQVTPSVRQRIDELGGIQWGALPMPLWAITAAARAARTGRAILPGCGSAPRRASGSWPTPHPRPVAAPAPGKPL